MYKIVGGDNKEYGPVTAEQVREWVLQNRANANTVVAFQGGPWKPLSTFPEFADLFRGLGALPPPPPPGGGIPPQVTINTINGPKTNVWAVAGLVLGIIAIVPCCWMCPLPALLGIVLGAIGLVQINGNPTAFKTSRTTALLGIGLSVVSIIFGVLAWNHPAIKKQIQVELDRIK